MTEFEMAYLANEIRTLIANYGMTIMTTVTTFLVAGYLVAHKLNRIMIGIVLSVFTYWYFSAVLIAWNLIADLRGVRDQVAAFASEGKGLAWHSLAHLPDQATQMALSWSGATFIAIIYGGSIVFFFQCRRINRTADTPAIAPVPTLPT